MRSRLPGRFKVINELITWTIIAMVSEIKKLKISFQGLNMCKQRV